MTPEERRVRYLREIAQIQASIESEGLLPVERERAEQSIARIQKKVVELGREILESSGQGLLF